MTRRSIIEYGEAVPQRYSRAAKKAKRLCGYHGPAPKGRDQVTESEG